jgi:hypothetical protein
MKIFSEFKCEQLRVIERAEVLPSASPDIPVSSRGDPNWSVPMTFSMIAYAQKFGCHDLEALLTTLALTLVTHETHHFDTEIRAPNRTLTIACHN